MKIVVFITLILALQLNGLENTYGSDQYTAVAPYASQSTRIKKVEAALSIARSVVHQAINDQAFMKLRRRSSLNDGPADWRSIYVRFLNDMSGEVSKTRIEVSYDTSRESLCQNSEGSWQLQDSGRAQATTSGESIYICNDGYKSSDAYLAQTIIHEYIHSIGYDIGQTCECIADEGAYLAFIAAGIHPGPGPYLRKYSFCKPSAQYVDLTTAELNVEHGAKSLDEIPVGTLLEIPKTVLKELSVNWTLLPLGGNLDEGTCSIRLKESIAAVKAPFLITSKYQSYGHPRFDIRDANKNVIDLTCASANEFLISDIERIGFKLRFKKGLK